MVMAAYGRKRTVTVADFSAIECPLLVKADIALLFFKNFFGNGFFDFARA